MSSSLLDSLLGDNANKQISDEHIEVISQDLCEKWRLLPAHLGLGTITIDDIIENEAGKRHFFTTWKDQKGSEATYRSLVSALLEIECRKDAESVCELLKVPAMGADSVQQDDQQHQQQQSLASSLNIRLQTSGIKC